MAYLGIVQKFKSASIIMRLNQNIHLTIANDLYVVGWPIMQKLKCIPSIDAVFNFYFSDF